MQVEQSRLSHLPTNFCFLYNGHPLDPNVEAAMKASEVAVSHESQYILLIDNVHCNIADPQRDRLLGLSPAARLIVLVLLFIFGGMLGCKLLNTPISRGPVGYEKVPLFAQNGDKPKAAAKGIPCLRPPCGILRVLKARSPKTKWQTEAQPDEENK
eukprot:4882851-Prymnesium_polylepis.1